MRAATALTLALAAGLVLTTPLATASCVYTLSCVGNTVVYAFQMADLATACAGGVVVMTYQAIGAAATIAGGTVVAAFQLLAVAGSPGDAPAIVLIVGQNYAYFVASTAVVTAFTVVGEGALLLVACGVIAAYGTLAYAATYLP